MLETPQRIEPALLEDGVPTALVDLASEIGSAATKLESALHPKTASGLAAMVRIMNCYYSNLIEGHNTRPRDIEAALQYSSIVDGKLVPNTSQIEDSLLERTSQSPVMRDLLTEARAHVRVQAQIDEMALSDSLPEPANSNFGKWLHKEFYAEASPEMLTVRGKHGNVRFVPGEWRNSSEHDVAVGRHVPPSSEVVADCMAYFERRYHFERLGKGARILAIPAAHHRFNYIHPFPDGNGRVSRLMSHAMAHAAGIGAHGLWSVSRGLARGIESRTDYKRMMDHADMPRQGDLDGRGNLSQKALISFCEWFLRVCLDQITFMSELFKIKSLGNRLLRYVILSSSLKPEAGRLLEEALIRGEVERGAIARITGMPERSARRVLADLIDEGLLASDTARGPLSLRFPVKAQDILFPRLFAES